MFMSFTGLGLLAMLFSVSFGPDYEKVTSWSLRSQFGRECKAALSRCEWLRCRFELP